MLFARSWFGCIVCGFFFFAVLLLPAYRADFRALECGSQVQLWPRSQSLTTPRLYLSSSDSEEGSECFDQSVFTFIVSSHCCTIAFIQYPLF